MKLVKIFIVFIFFYSNDIIGQEKVSDCYQLISGVVKNRTTSDFISDASVKLYQGSEFIKTSITNSKGAYNFKANCQKPYSIVVDKTNYTSSKKSFTTSNSINNKLNFSIYLEETSSICDQILRGRIFNDLTDEPIENVTVLINDIYGNTIATEITNIYGNYHFNIPCGKEYKVIYSKENFITQFKDLGVNKIDKNLQRNDIRLKSNKCRGLIKGRVINAKTNLPVSDANISLLKNNTELDSKISTKDGGFQIEANCNSDYKLRTYSEGYQVNTISISSFHENSMINDLYIGLKPAKVKVVNDSKPIIINTDNQPSIEPQTDKAPTTKIKVTPQSSNKTAIEPKNMTFDLNESIITRKISIELNKMVELLKYSSNINIELRSHTDSRGPDQYNLNLTEARAQAMVSYIISKGIDSNRISGKGYGETELMNKCSNKIKCKTSLHKENKRIEFLITVNKNE